MLERYEILPLTTWYASVYVVYGTYSKRRLFS